MECKEGELIDQDTKKIYSVIGLLGSGQYGKIYYAKDLETKEEYAIKILKEEDNKFNSKIKIIDRISSLQSQFIIKPFSNGIGSLRLGIIEEESKQYIVYEYASKGALIDFITKINPYSFLEEKYAKILFNYILKGIQAMHNNKEYPLCHRDIKPENILLDDNFHPKICDFGFASSALKIFSKRAGTYGYCGPEILVDKKERAYNGKKADIFSLGITLLKIVTGRKGDDHYKYLSNFDKYFELFDVNIIKISDKVKNLIKKMVRFNPKERPDINELIKDPWFEDFNENDEILMKDYYKEFNRRYEQIKNKNKTINPMINNDDKKKPNQNKSGAINDNKDEDFKNDFILKYIDDNDINLKNYIKINGDIKPRIIMNLITKKLKKEFKEYINNEKKNKNENCEFFLDASKNYYKFKIKIEYDQDDNSEEDDDNIPDEEN